METILIGLLGGLITGISPCILPVLPVIFLTAGARTQRSGSEANQPSGAARNATMTTSPPQVIEAPRSRPYFVIAGLTLSFTLVTLLGSLLLGLLNLPQDVLRWAGIIVLVIIGIGILVPGVERILEKPFSKIPRRNVSDKGNGFGMGLALGTVFVPCAGPVLAAIIVAGTTGRIDASTVLLTVSFAIGVSIPLLAFALAGRQLTTRLQAFRKREKGLRIAAGVALIALAIGLVFNVPQMLQRLLPDYSAGIQQELADSDAAGRALNLGGIITDENRDLDQCSNGATQLEECGQAPSIRGIEEWLNTENGAGVDLKDLRGDVVLVDFWAYSCINCQRSVPHVVAWDEAYRDAGLSVVGVHSPEYAFEKNANYVADGAESFDITYPVALDNNLSTWTNYRNRYWPAHYLIDASGTVRHVSFGEGNYAATEKMIRELLQDANPGATLPGATDIADETPEIGSTTQETFLGSTKESNFSGAEKYRKGVTTFELPETQPKDTFALDGDWKLETQYATPVGPDASVRLAYRGEEVRVVIAGEGEMKLSVDGGAQQRIEVSGVPRSYELVAEADGTSALLDLQVSEGVRVYSFTFG